MMHFGRTNSFTEYNMNNQKLETVTEDKDLGVILSQDFTKLLERFIESTKLPTLLSKS